MTYSALLPAPLEATLRGVLPVLERETRSPWWLIGSAALAAWGVPGIAYRDLDVLVAPSDAERLEVVWAQHRDSGCPPADGDRFRSRFARFSGFALPVETMGGLELCADSTWRPVRPADRRKMALPFGNLYLPSLPALIEILVAFGRPKDFANSVLARNFLAAAPALPETTSA